MDQILHDNLTSSTRELGKGKEMKIRFESWVALALLMFSFARMLLGSGKQLNSSDLTRQLSKIFAMYDKRILPTVDGYPVNTSMQIYIGDMVPLKHYHMHYEIHIFARQIWKDYRLNISFGDLDWTAFGIETFRDIWIPEIHFPTAKKGKWYYLMKKNTALHIRKEGTIFLSRRVSLTLYCPMNLQNFPFDVQECKLYVRLYAYNNEHCRLKWSYDKGGPIFLAKQLATSEFALTGISYSTEINDLAEAGQFDTLTVTLQLARKKAHYLVNYMLPTGMIVILSWVGFWIDYRATPARCSLSITTVLTITTLTNSIRASLPQVGYIKSLDVYLISCFFFVFASTIEFAITGVTDKKWLKTYKNRRKAATENIKEQRKKENTQEPKFGPSHSDKKSPEVSKRMDETVVGCELSEISLKVQSTPNIDDPVSPRQRKGRLTINHDIGAAKSIQIKTNRDGFLKRHWHAFVEKIIEKHCQTRREVHIIDKISRVLFPVAFLLFNAAYFVIVFFLM